MVGERAAQPICRGWKRAFDSHLLSRSWLISLLQGIRFALASERNDPTKPYLSRSRHGFPSSARDLFISPGCAADSSWYQ
jgi:hypothetical protein